MEKNVNLSMAIIPNDFLEQLEERLKRIESIIVERSKVGDSDIYMDTLTARKMLGFCARTLQEYRDRRIIGFHQVGRKVTYRRSDIDKFLDEHYIVRAP